MSSFPAIYSGSVALYPLTETYRRPVTVLQYNNATEQRWRTGKALRAFSLDFTDVSKTDMLTIRSFFDTMKGGFDHTWDISIGGTVYSNMTFENDEMAAQERPGGAYSFSLPCRQVKP